MSLSTSSSRKHIVLFVITFVPLALTWTFFGRSIFSTALKSEKTAMFWQKKVNPELTFDILFVGDSRVYRGISPSITTSLINKDLSSHNLGLSSAIFDEEYYQFIESKFSKDPKQKILVLGITLHSLVKGKKNRHLDQINSDFTKSYFVPTLKIKELLKSLKILIGRKKVSYIEEYKPDGWVSSYKIGNDPLEAIKNYKQTLKDYKIDPIKMDLLCNKIRYFKTKGVLVFSLRVPTSSEMTLLENKYASKDFLQLDDFTTQCGSIWLPTNENYNSYDGSHLHFKSAIELSKKIGLSISQYLGENNDNR